MMQKWTRLVPAFLRSRLEGRSSLQNAIRNTGWLLADSIFKMLVGLAVGVWVARYLGPERFGLFSFALAFVTLFAPLASLGLEDIVVRDLVHDQSAKDEILGTAFVLKLIGGLTSCAAAIAVIHALRPGDREGQWLVGILALGGVFQALGVIESWFHSQVQAKYAVLARSTAFLVCSIAKAALVIWRASLTWFAVVTTAEVALTSLGLVAAYTSRTGRATAWRATLTTARSLVRDSWPLFFSVVSITLYQRIDQIMLQEMAGSSEVGIYSVAVRLADAWVFIPSAIYWSAFPSILEAKRTSEAAFLERLQRFYNLMAFAAYVVAVGATVAGPWLVGLLFGDAYSGSGMILVILVWANLFTNLEIARTAFLNAQNWNRLYLAAIVLGAALNVALNYVLIPRFGGLGAAVASLVAYWFAAHGSCFVFRDLRRTGLMLTRAMLYPRVW